MTDIVYIDDEPSLLRSMSVLLEYEGFSVKSFVDPQEGIEFVNSNEVGLVLCDYRMPSMSGLKVLAAIESPVLFYLFSGDMTLSDHPGVHGLLQKPMTARALCQKLSRALGREETS